MIGKDIRGIHHLISSITTYQSKILFFIDFDLFPKYGKCFILGKDENKVLIIANNVIGDNSNVIARRYESLDGVDDIIPLIQNFPRALAIKTSDSNFEINRYIHGIILLNENFDGEYSKFIESNKKFINYHSINTNDSFSMYLYCITNGSKNFYNWAYDLNVRESTPLALIRLIMKWEENYGQLVKNLSKGSITSYTSRSSAYSAFREMIELRESKRANDAINFFNTAQKKLLKEHTLTPKDVESLSKFTRLSLTKRRNFVRKMSTVTNVSEILHNLSLVTNMHFNWSKKSVLEYIENSEFMDCSVIKDEGNILLVKVNNYEAIKNLGRLTSWCISKNKTYWNDYVETNKDSTQYVLFDFNRKEDDKLSIVGFTSLLNYGIRHAHNLNNDNLMGPAPRENNMNVFLPRKLGNNIFDILSHNNIRIDEVTKYNPLPFEWNKESFINFIKSNSNSCKILLDKDSMVVVSAIGNMSRILGERYSSIFGKYYYSNEHIFFVDFSEKEKNGKSVLFSLINRNDTTSIDVPTFMYDFNLNEKYCTFDAECVKFGVPYDIISRPNNIEERFNSAISNSDVIVLNSLLEDETLKQKIKKHKLKIDKGCFNDSLNYSLFNSNSFDFVDAFYNNGIKISDIIGENSLYKVVSRVLNNLESLSHGTFVTKANFVDEVNNGTVTNRERDIYVNSEVFKHIVMMEENLNIMGAFNSKLASYPPNEFFTKFVKFEAAIIDANKITKFSKNLSLALKYGIDNKISEVLLLIDANKAVQSFLKANKISIPHVINV